MPRARRHTPAQLPATVPWTKGGLPQKGVRSTAYLAQCFLQPAMRRLFHASLWAAPHTDKPSKEALIAQYWWEADLLRQQLMEWCGIPAVET